MDLSDRRGLPGLSYPEEYLRRLATELATKFSGVFNTETVERYVLESYTALLRTSTVTAHLASRTTRFASDRLTALAQAKGAIDSPCRRSSSSASRTPEGRRWRRSWPTTSVAAACTCAQRVRRRAAS
ncbi:MAG: hypothetical protein WED09_03320 [Homoserinimonas sp.]